MQSKHPRLPVPTKNLQQKQFVCRLKKKRARYRPTFESLEQRNLLTAAWSNPLFSFDVDDDGFVAPIDALLVFNELNARGSRPLSAPFDNNSTTGYVDVNGDEFVTAF